MHAISIRSPQLADGEQVLRAIHESQSHLSPWVVTPKTDIEFLLYCQRVENDPAFLGYLLFENEQVAGMININNIVRGAFQSASIGFYLFSGFTGRGVMSEGIKQVLENVFSHHQLHRVEANIQPSNASSLRCVQRNGFVKEGFSKRFLKVNGQWRDHERWALTRESWEGVKA